MTEQELYTFGDLTLDVANRRLSRRGLTIPLAPKAHDLLVHLVRHAGRLVTKHELLDSVWAGCFVEEGILSVHVSGIRKALGDNNRSPHYIETVSRSGYRFIAAVAPAHRSIGVFGDWIDANRGRIAQAPSAPEVYEGVGRGRSHVLSFSITEVPKAIAEYEAAIQRDPSCAAAHAGLALACCMQAEFRLAPQADAYSRARAEALRALALDDACADAQVALGAIAFLGEWDWVGAERSLQRALEINPSHSEAYVLYGRLLETLGRLQEGLAMKTRALERNPFSPYVHLAIAMSHWLQRRYQESILWANKTLELDPTHLVAREHLAGAYWALGDFDRHMAEGIRHAESYGVPADFLEAMKQVYASGGRPGIVRWILDTQGDRLPSFQLALLHSELRHMDEAVGHLERAIDRHEPCLVELAVAPQWDRLRAHPRFQQCLARMGLIS